MVIYKDNNGCKYPPSILSGEYTTIFGYYGCEKFQPPPSSEIANCIKIDKIKKELEDHGCNFSGRSIKSQCIEGWWLNGQQQNKTCVKWTKKLPDICRSCYERGKYGWCATCKVKGVFY